MRRNWRTLTLNTIKLLHRNCIYEQEGGEKCDGGGQNGVLRLEARKEYVNRSTAIKKKEEEGYRDGDRKGGTGRQEK